MPLTSSLSRLCVGELATVRSASATSGIDQASSVAMRRIPDVIALSLVSVSVRPGEARGRFAAADRVREVEPHRADAGIGRKGLAAQGGVGGERFELFGRRAEAAARGGVDAGPAGDVVTEPDVIEVH